MNYQRLIKIRRSQSAFSPNADQTVLDLDQRVFSLVRSNNDTKEKIKVLVNVSMDSIEIPINYKGLDIINGEVISNKVFLKPNAYRWIKINQEEL